VITPGHRAHREQSTDQQREETRHETVGGPEKGADHCHELHVTGGRSAADVKRNEAGETERPPERGKPELSRPEHDGMDEQAECGAAEAQTVRDASTAQVAPSRNREDGE
jgi:hypothetical protein